MIDQLSSNKSISSTIRLYTCFQMSMCTIRESIHVLMLKIVANYNALIDVIVLFPMLKNDLRMRA